ncbi:MAG: hypothetical protein WA194_00570 [Patescibacteria group bacterium]
MNAKQKKMAIAAAAIIVAVPAIGFAAASTSTGSAVVTKAFREMRGGSGSHMGEGRGMKDGGFGGMMGGNAGMFSNEKIRTALAASGVTLPTADEAKAFQEKMKTARDAESKLSDTDKTTLKTMRDATQQKIQAIHEESAKAEREYLRSKGVAIPTEEEFAKITETMKKAAEVLKAQHPNLGKEFGEGREGGRGHGRGMRGGMGMGFGPSDNDDVPAAGAPETPASTGTQGTGGAQ